MVTITYAEQQEFFERLNTFTAGTQNFVNTVGLTNGGFVAAYNTATTNRVYLNFYDAAFNPVGGERAPFLFPTRAVGQPSITQLSDGNVLVVWAESADGNQKISGALFSSTGTPIGSEVGLGFFTDAVTQLDVTVLADGHFVVTFARSTDIYQAVYDANGGAITPLGGELPRVNEVTAGLQTDSQIAALADGGYVISWTNTQPTDQQIKAKIFAADGTVRVAEFLVASGGDNTQPAIVALHNGNFAIAYTDSGWAEGGTLGNGISLQIFTPGGSNVTPGTIIHVNAPTTGDEIDPDITILDNGFIVVSWSHQTSASNHDVYYALFDQNGGRLQINGSNLGLLAAGSGDEVGSSLSSVLNGRFLAGWQDSGTTDIQGKINEIVRNTTGDSTSETLTGDSLRDIINAGDGKDILNGVTGRDELHGQGGDDTIVIDHAQTVAGIVYDGGAGRDLLRFGLTSGAAFDYGLRDDTIISIEKLQFEDPGVSGFSTLRLDAAQFSDNGIFTEAQFIGVNYTDVTEKLEVWLGAATSIDLSSLTFIDFAQPRDSVVINGSGVADTIIGTSVNDVIDGKAGADKMTGGFGNDLYYVDNAGDVVTELADGGTTDKVITSVSYTLSANIEKLALAGRSAIDGIGNASVNIMAGNSASNLLDGKAGADTMIGGGGSDTYVVDDAGDVVTELAGGGTADKVMSSISYTLDAQLENLVLTGTAAINGTGNASANSITGNSAANSLDGKAGADTMAGKGGDDTYFVDNAGDVVIEAAGGGYDRVRTDSSYTLTAEVEALILTGSAAIDGTGNELANNISGNAAANIIDGKGGSDFITGNAGADTFVVSSALGTASATLADFSVVDDTIQLSAAIFTVLGAGALPAYAFKDRGDGATVDADDRIIYNHLNGVLFYDQDGAGGVAAVQFAVIATHAILTADDFVIV